MPKDKEKKISYTTVKMSSLPMAKEAGVMMNDLAVDPGYLIKEIGEKKAESDPAVKNCYYFASDEKCPGYMGNECSYVIKNGTMVMAHRSCQQRSQNAEKKAPKVMIR